MLTVGDDGSAPTNRTRLRNAKRARQLTGDAERDPGADPGGVQGVQGVSRVSEAERDPPRTV